LPSPTPWIFENRGKNLIWMYKVYNPFFPICLISSDPPFIEWHVQCTYKTFISLSFLKQLKCMSHFCWETTNENNQFSKWETWILIAKLDQTKLWRVLLWIRIKIMSVNFEEKKKEIYKIKKKIMKRFKRTAFHLMCNKT